MDCLNSIESLQPIVVGSDAGLGDDVVVGHGPGEGDVERRPGVHVGGMRDDAAGDVEGVVSEVRLEGGVVVDLHVQPDDQDALLLL